MTPHEAHRLFGGFVPEPTEPEDPQALIRTLEAELTQARADARVLAEEVRAQRGDPCYDAIRISAAKDDTDASGALERNKP